MFDVDKFRKFYMVFAEAIDAYRITPRIMVVAYSYMLYRTLEWYMNLKPSVIINCTKDIATNCIADAPTTQHAALVTAVVSMAAVIFGLYTNSGRDWSKPFNYWKKKEDKDDEKSLKEL